MAPPPPVLPPDPYHEANFTALSRRHFSLAPHEWQGRVGGFIMQETERKHPCRTLCIQGTGKGKSLLYQTLCSHFKGVSIYISPLLTLGADQVHKLIKKTDMLGSTVIPVPLDNFSSNEQIDDLIKSICLIRPEISVVVFASPQTITLKFKTFISRIKPHIRFIIVDEIHMFNAFGRTFRDEFLLLKRKLFRAVGKKLPMLFLTATCTQRILESFETMIGVKITHIKWPPPSDFSNRRVSLHVSYAQKPFSKFSSQLADIIKNGRDEATPSKCIFYSNIRRKVLDLKEKIGNVLDADDELQMHDVLGVHGTLSKKEKEMYIKMFLDSSTVGGDDIISVLCATSGVGNVGLDSPDIRAVFRVDFPPSILDIVQESGRAGRIENPDPLKYSYNLSFCIESFLYLYERP